MPFRTSIAALSTCLCGPVTVVAHHSGAAYDMTRLVTIEGKVAALSWKNPHISMTVETEGPDGAPRPQEIEVMAVSQAGGLGLRREAISPGARVVARAKWSGGRLARYLAFSWWVPSLGMLGRSYLSETRRREPLLRSVSCPARRRTSFRSCLPHMSVRFIPISRHPSRVVPRVLSKWPSTRSLVSFYWFRPSIWCF